MLNKVLKLVSEELDVDVSRLTLESGSGTIAEWDSLAQLNIVSLIENEFDITLELEDIIYMNNIQDIINVVEGKKGKKDAKLDSSVECMNQSDVQFTGLLTPNNLIAGRGSIDRLGEFTEGSVLIVLGSKKYSEKLARKVKSIIGKNAESVTIVHKAFGEPSEDRITELVSTLTSIPNTIVGIGGGSVLDTCKLVYTKLLYSNNELSDWKEPFSLPNHTDIDLISIPTTHGSGSETSSAAVFNTSSSKQIILSHQFISKVVIHDSELLTNLPKNVAIDTALDAFTHSMEGYLSKLDHPNVNPLIIESLSLITKTVSNFEEFSSQQSKERLLWASYLAGIVQNHCSTGLCHSISHQFSRFGVAHGRLNSIFLPDVLKFNYSQSKNELDTLSSDIGFDSGEELLEWLFEIKDKYDIGDLTEYIDIGSVDLKALVKDIKNDITYSTTPFEIEDNELICMLKEALNI